MITIDQRLLEILKASSCFGIAYDPEAPECSKLCDVQAQCRLKVEGQQVPTPTSRPKKASVDTEVKDQAPKNNTKKGDNKPQSSNKKPPSNKPSTPKPKASEPPVGDMPDFKPMGFKELVELAEKRDVQWKDYGNENITRMRLIMNLKKSYGL